MHDQHHKMTEHLFQSFTIIYVMSKCFVQAFKPCRKGLGHGHPAWCCRAKRQENLLWATRALRSLRQRKISCLSRRKKACNMHPTTNPCNTNEPHHLLLLPCVMSVGHMLGNGQRGHCPPAVLGVLLVSLLPTSPRTSW